MSGEEKERGAGRRGVRERWWWLADVRLGESSGHHAKVDLAGCNDWRQGRILYRTRRKKSKYLDGNHLGHALGAKIRHEWGHFRAIRL